MIELNLEETANTPKVSYDTSDNRLDLEGRLLPEHPGPFFEKLYRWLEDAKNSDQSNFTISFYLYYYNTTSTKMLVMFFQEVDRQLALGLNITLEWKYDEEDEDAFDDGTDFKKASKVNIKLIGVPEED
jgi:hypothetical protein